MQLYDNLINNCLGKIQKVSKTTYAYRENLWQESQSQEMILKSEMAFELGGDNKKGISITAITCDDAIVNQDEIIVVGEDLPNIHKDTSYIRLAFLLMENEGLDTSDHLYNEVKRVDYAKYHMFPKGFMIRVSQMNHKESIRVSKEAIQNGITFEKVGSSMISSFYENPKVKAVKLVFITDESFDYDLYAKEERRCYDITKTIDHIFKNVTMDCDTCGLKVVCEEVEGLRELHFENHDNTK